MPRDLSYAGMMLASPNQASAIFNPDGPHPARQKNAFVVRFMRNNDPAQRDGLTFVVKSIDRPSVQPVVEEINQYNRKRLIHTGVKYQPINCNFYDTADGAAMNMWIEYARYYFGDYRLDPSDYRDDILNPQINSGPFRDGAGVGIQPASVAFPDGINSQFFFDKIIIYQVWGNEYTSTELLRPRINSFSPDELTYEDGGVPNIQITIQYEAIHHGNRGRPQDLFTEASLETIFSNSPFNGQTLEVLSPPKGVSFAGNVTQGSTAITTDLTGAILPSSSAAYKVDRTTFSSDGGVLARFGNFTFGEPSLNSRILPTGLDQTLGQSETLRAAALTNPSYNRTDDVVFNAAGESALRINGLSRALNVAATENNGSAIDEADRTNGLRLSDNAISAFNDQMDGTFLGGFNNR